MFPRPAVLCRGCQHHLQALTIQEHREGIGNISWNLSSWCVISSSPSPRLGKSRRQWSTVGLLVGFPHTLAPNFGEDVNACYCICPPAPWLLTSNVWALPLAPELANLEGAEEEDPELLVDNQSWLDAGSEHDVEKDPQPGPKRRARQLTEEDLPINDYVSEGNCTLGCPGNGPRMS